MTAAADTHGREVSMRQVFDTLRWIAGPAGVPRRGAIVVALGALLINATVASAREPGRSSGPYAAAEQGFGLTTPVAQAPQVVDSPADDGGLEVRTADWLEANDGNAAEQSFDVEHVTPVAAESETAADAATPAEESAATVAAETGDSDVSPPVSDFSTMNDPLARLKWSSASEQIDPAETLRDWAEGAGLLVAFVVVSLWIVRQYVAKRANPGGPTTHMRTIESLTLPQRCRVHLVDIGGRQVLVAADAAGVKCITVLPDRFTSMLDDATHEPTPPAASTEPDRDQIWEALRESRLT